VTEKYNFTDKSIKVGQWIFRYLDHERIKKEAEYKGSSELMHSVISLEALGWIIRDHQDTPGINLDIILERDHLTFTEALLILHGLYPTPGLDINQAPDPSLFDYSLLLDYFQVNSREYRQLLSAIQAGKGSTRHGIKSDSENGVYTESFIPWAIDKGFIEEKVVDNNVNPKVRNYPEDFSKTLHKQLTKNGLISGIFNDMWTWLPNHKNTLGYLADELSSKFSDTCPVHKKQPNLTAYIKYEGAKFRSMAVSKDYEIKDKIDLAISEMKKIYTS